MARADLAHPSNSDGPWFVDTRCIGCDVSRHWAPGLIEMGASGLSFVARQPADADEASALWRAAAACPTQSVGNRDQRRPPAPPFPFEMTPGVWALGHNARSLFGAHSYLVERPEGNIMVDSPRYLRSLAERVGALGGVAQVLLSHRDDVADADKWAEHFGAEVWIHAAEADAAPYATAHFTGDEEVTISPGANAIPTPGHTEGSVVLHVDDRWLFTGDSLHWNHRRDELDVTPNQTFYSWTALADSMDRLAELRVEWIFSGHGKWHQVGFEQWNDHMAVLGADMRRLGRSAWAERPQAAFAWD